MGIYADDEVVRSATRMLVDSGVRVFQIFQRGTEREHVSFLLSEFNPPRGAVVLDAGCGVGEVAALMKEERPDLDFVLLNLSPAQLAMCPIHFRAVCGSIEDIPLPTASVDAAISCYVIGHVDQGRAMAELRRVVKPGGVIFIADMKGGDMGALDYVAHDWQGYEPAGMNTNAFERLMPDFRARHPNIRPVIVREVRA